MILNYWKVPADDSVDGSFPARRTTMCDENWDSSAFSELNKYLAYLSVSHLLLIIRVVLSSSSFSSYSSASTASCLRIELERKLWTWTTYKEDAMQKWDWSGIWNTKKNIILVSLLRAVLIRFYSIAVTSTSSFCSINFHVPKMIFERQSGCAQDAMIIIVEQWCHEALFSLPSTWIKVERSGEEERTGWWVPAYLVQVASTINSITIHPPPCFNSTSIDDDFTSFILRTRLCQSSSFCVFSASISISPVWFPFLIAR